MSLSRLLKTLTLLVTLVAIALIMRVSFDAWGAVRMSTMALQTSQNLRLVLTVAEMASRERGPTNSILGSAFPPSAASASALATARTQTDAAFAAARQAHLGEGDLHAHVLSRVDVAQAALRQARAEVDRIASLPRPGRQPQAIRSVVHDMVAVVSTLAPATIALANQLQQGLPVLEDVANGALLTAELREQAGLLGSHFTAALASKQPFTPAERSAIERTQGRIDQLRSLIDLRVRVPNQAATVLTAWQAMEQSYFGSAKQLLADVIATGNSNGQFEIDAASFAAQYVPDMKPMFALRDAWLDLAETRAMEERSDGRITLAIVGLCSAALLGLLLATMRVLNRRVLTPLTGTTLALRAMARNQQELPLPKCVANDEIAAVVGAVQQLQIMTRARTVLEVERNELIQRLSEQSNTDFLTGLSNRRAFLATAERDLALALRHGTRVAIIMLDVDHFKRFNDSLGHAAGDQALIAVAQAMGSALRGSDLIARFGGEEFVMLLGHCERDQAKRLSERVRDAIASMQIELPDGQTRSITASLGVAHSDDLGFAMERLLSCADAAMYEAKNAGRNRVVFFSPEDQHAMHS